MSSRTVGVCALALGLALIVGPIPETAAAAGQARVAKARKKHRARFLSAPAPGGRAKTPAARESASGGQDAGVATGALEGAFRMDALDRGALLSMGTDRALVLTSYRGLTIVDTSDPLTPRRLGSVAVAGAGRRIFGDADRAVVLSDTWTDSGPTTTISVVDLADETAPQVVGTTQVAGTLQDAVAAGDEILALTVDGWGWGYPSPLADAATGVVGAANTADIAWWGGSGSAHVVRAAIGTDGVPGVLGEVTLDGNVLAATLTADEAAVVVQTWSPPSMGPAAPDPVGTAPVTTLVHITTSVDSGAPVTAGSLALGMTWGVGATDLAGSVLRTVTYEDAGTFLRTFDLAGGAPETLGVITLGADSYGGTFVGDTLATVRTEWTGGPVYPGTGNALGVPAVRKSGGNKGPAPTSRVWLCVVDVADPAHPLAGSDIDLGSGSAYEVRDVGGTAVVVLNGDDAVSTVVRVDVAAGGPPVVTGTAEVDGYRYVQAIVDDVLLLGGGTWSEDDGSYATDVVPVRVDAAGVVPGGRIATGSWTTAAARDGDLLGIAAFDRLTLVDLSTFATPVALGELRLVVNVADLALLSDDVAAALVTDWVSGAIEIRTVALPAADPLDPLDTLTIGHGDARLFRQGDILWVLATDWSTDRSVLRAVDASDPAHLRLRGTIDLSSYPGQVFLHRGALLLLRPAWSLVRIDDTTGRVAKGEDSFGVAPPRWTRFRTGAVLDVVDLSDPDAPRAAVRRRLDWDADGQAVLAGDVLYVPSYYEIRGGPRSGASAYVVAPIGVEDPLAPRIGRPVNVPGTLVAATPQPGRVLTVSWNWSDSTGSGPTLHLVDLGAAWTERVVAAAVLPGQPGAVVIGADHVYVATESWGPFAVLSDTRDSGAVDPATGGVAAAPSTSTAALQTFALFDLSETARDDRARGAWGGVVADGHLFLRTWGWEGAVDVYDLGDASTPVFASTHSVAGPGDSVHVAGDRAYIPAGLAGIEVIELGP